MRFDRIDPAPFVIDIGTTENLVLNMNGGNDAFSATGNLATLIKIAVDGGAGNDTILGSNGIDALTGGTGNDFIDDQQGNDVAFLGAGNDVFLTLNGGLGDDVLIGGEGDDLMNGGDGGDLALMGAGDDTFVWNPGDDNDTIEGQNGSDTLLFNGANAGENITISANGGRVTFFRDVATVTVDLDDVESIEFNALGGADTIVVNDLRGTDATEVNINLATINGAGDGQPDGDHQCHRCRRCDHRRQRRACSASAPRSPSPGSRRTTGW